MLFFTEIPIYFITVGLAAKTLLNIPLKRSGLPLLIYSAHQKSGDRVKETVHFNGVRHILFVSAFTKKVI